MKWFDTSLWNNFNIKQVNIVDNPAKGTIRGFHAQSEELAEGKLVTCLRGKILDVVFDIRENSKTYGTTNSFILDMNKPSCLFVPRGCLHAYQVLEDCTLVGYLSTICTSQIANTAYDTMTQLLQHHGEIYQLQLTKIDSCLSLRTYDQPSE